MTHDPRVTTPPESATTPDAAAPAPPPAPRRTRTPRPRRPSRPPRPALQGTPAIVQTAFLMVALVSLWFCAQAFVLSGLSHDRSQALLYERYRTQLSDLTAPLGPTVPPGDPVALLRIPAIDLDEVVVEGTASGDTLAGPGHQRNTPLPGQVGTSYVFGRSATNGAPFRDLTALRPGDRVELVTGQGERTLTVIGVREDGDPRPPAPRAGVTRLTLVTAVGDGRLSAFTPDTTVYVDAEARDGAPAPSGRPTQVPESEQALATDDGARPFLALSLALLLALTLGVVAARQRWSAVLVWVLASPLALALAWMTTDTVFRLLPNLV